MAGAEGPAGANAAFRRDIRLLVTGNAVSTLGNAVYLIAVTLLLKSLTESVFVLGLFQFVALAPAFLLSPVAGAIVDRSPRRAVIVVSDLLRGILMVGAGIGLLVPALRTPLFVLTVSFLAGIGNAVFVPAALALLPDLVPANRLHTATGFRAASSQAANLVGNALGGALFVALGAPILFIFNGITFVLSGIQERFISRAGAPHSRGRERILQSARAGLAAAAKDRTVLRLIISQAGLYLLSPALLLSLPFLVIDDLGLSEQFVGLFFALALAGGILVFVALRFISSRKLLSIPVIGIAYSGLAVSFLAVSLSTSVPVLIIVALVFGAAAAMVYLFTTTWIQIRTPAAMHGRLFALLEAATAFVAPVSYLVAGTLLESLGDDLRWVFFVVAGIAAATWAAVNRIRDFSDPQP